MGIQGVGLVLVLVGVGLLVYDMFMGGGIFSGEFWSVGGAGLVVLVVGLLVVSIPYVAEAVRGEGSQRTAHVSVFG